MKKTIITSILFISMYLFASTNPKVKADIISVEVSKISDKEYRFSVGIKSDDKGCKQFANWWEVIDENGKLVYRRILFHSHTTEQPFVRSGIVKGIDENKKLYIRAHMNNVGYSGNVYSGTIKSGFKNLNKDINFSKNIEKQEPQPNGCAF